MEVEINTKLLEEIGLTGSEIKVYLALLKLGLSQKGQILKESKIAPSKIYYVIDKLKEKGLASEIIKNNVKHFSPAHPSRINDYLRKKEIEIKEQEKSFNSLLPNLLDLQKQSKEETKVEVFVGWEGMLTAYRAIVDTSKKGESYYVFGAGKDPEEKKRSNFYIKHTKSLLKDKSKIKIIFDQSSREYVDKAERVLGFKYNKRFLYQKTPTEVTIHRDKVAIIIRKIEPIVILITDKETAQSFKTYFNELWKIAKR